MDFEATRAIRKVEVGTARTILERTEKRFGLTRDYLVADTAYGSAEILAWLAKQKQITAHKPVLFGIPDTIGSALDGLAADPAFCADMGADVGPPYDQPKQQPNGGNCSDEQTGPFFPAKP